MVDLLKQLFSVMSQKEIVPRQWRRALLLIYLRKRIGRTLVGTGVLPCLLTLGVHAQRGLHCCRKCFVRFLTIDWCSV